MNNEDFRKLLNDSPSSQPSKSTASASTHRPTTSLLGSRNRSLPFKPRSVQQQPKKVKGSIPKGVKYSSEYQDRAAQRLQAENGEEVKDEREVRIKALEEQLKLGQIDRATFENLRDKITGGEESATHLVKGLDRQLLAKIRAERNAADEESGATEVDIDGELDQLETKEVAPVQREVAEKRGVVAKAAPVAGQKRSRNDILAELRASRKAVEEAKPVPKSTLGAGFKKLGGRRTDGPKIEIDEKGRQVLITVDENGRTKRKVRKVQQPASTITRESYGTVNMKPLGMEVPGYQRVAEPVDEDEELDDLFEGAGSSYDPLAALRENEDDDDASSDSDSDKEHDDTKRKHPEPSKENREDKRDSASQDDRSSPSATPSPRPATSATKNNYFNDTSASQTKNDPSSIDALKDPSLMAALRLAARRDKQAAEEKAAKDAAPSPAAHRLLQQRDRDLDDIDMGFGGSRGDDGEDDDEGDSSRVKLREWKGLGADDEDDGEGEKKGRGGQKQRKRGKKKKGGDKNSAADVMRVVEGRRNK